MKNQKRTGTLIEKMGFKDKDIKESTHDEICLFLADKLSLSGFLTRHNIILINSKNSGHNRKATPDEFINNVNIEFEKAIITERGYNIGFLDILITLPDYNYEYRFVEETSKNKINPTPIRKIVIEVKSKMPSFGEIVREVNFYRCHFHKSQTRFVVVAPSCNFITQLESQGIIYMKPYWLKLSKEKLVKD